MLRKIKRRLLDEERQALEGRRKDLNNKAEANDAMRKVEEIEARKVQDENDRALTLKESRYKG